MRLCFCLWKMYWRPHWLLLPAWASRWGGGKELCVISFSGMLAGRLWGRALSSAAVSTVAAARTTTATQFAKSMPGPLVAKLRANLKLAQLKKALKMHERGVALPQHMLAINPLLSWPVRGAHPALSVALRKKGGRNHHGHITCRHRGGGFKRRIRILDRVRAASGLHRVIRLEHDPNRSARIALVQSGASGCVSYVLAWDGMKAGDTFENDGSLQLAGSTQRLRDIALGTIIHNIEVRPGTGGQLCRSAGCKAQLVAKDPAAGKSKTGLATIRLPSDKLARVPLDCRATIGVVSNPQWHLRVIGTAGRNRRLGWRPSVRGVAMNAIDHPHGGGKGGRSKGKPSQSPWGKICK